MKPDDAIGLAAKLIKDHMQIFINFEDWLDRSVDEPALSARPYNCLKNANIRSIHYLVERARDARDEELR